jgi:hypothetical protein
MHKKRSSKLFAIPLALLLVILSGCNAGGVLPVPTVSESPDGYSVLFRYASYTRFEGWPELFADEFVFPQVKMTDIEKETQINAELLAATTDWISGSVTRSDPSVPSILCHSNRYLSVSTQFYFEEEPRNWRIYDYVTIDVVNGERVFLDDLINVDDSFVEALKKGDVVTYSDDEIWGISFDVEDIIPIISALSDEDVLEMLNYCSIESSKLRTDAVSSYDLFSRRLHERSSFSLKDGYLLLHLKPPTEYRDFPLTLAIDIDGISEYLKVEKW